jgi:hypothetical protein
MQPGKSRFELISRAPPAWAATTRPSIYGNGTTLVQAAREGDFIGGVQLGGSMFLSDGSGGQDGRASGLNDCGQIAFQSQLVSDGGSGIFLFTPGLSPPTGLLGDYNNNGKVDGADYVVWRNVQGTTTILPNDPHGGTIGANQYNTWRANFGAMAGSGSIQTLPSENPVPEPNCLALFTAIVILVGARKRASCQMGKVERHRL